MNDHMHSCPNRPPIETKRGKLGVGRWGMEGKRREEKKKMKKGVLGGTFTCLSMHGNGIMGTFWLVL